MHCAVLPVFACGGNTGEEKISGLHPTPSHAGLPAPAAKPFNQASLLAGCPVAAPEETSLSD